MGVGLTRRLGGVDTARAGGGSAFSGVDVMPLAGDGGCVTGRLACSDDVHGARSGSSGVRSSDVSDAACDGQTKRREGVVGASACVVDCEATEVATPTFIELLLVCA